MEPLFEALLKKGEDKGSKREFFKVGLNIVHVPVEAGNFEGLSEERVRSLMLEAEERELGRGLDEGLARDLIIFTSPCQKLPSLPQQLEERVKRCLGSENFLPPDPVPWVYWHSSPPTIQEVAASGEREKQEDGQRRMKELMSFLTEALCYWLDPPERQEWLVKLRDLADLEGVAPDQDDPFTQLRLRYPAHVLSLPKDGPRRDQVRCWWRRLGLEQEVSFTQAIGVADLHKPDFRDGYLRPQTKNGEYCCKRGHLRSLQACHYLGQRWSILFEDDAVPTSTDLASLARWIQVNARTTSEPDHLMVFDQILFGSLYHEALVGGVPGLGFAAKDESPKAEAEKGMEEGRTPRILQVRRAHSTFAFALQTREVIRAWRVFLDPRPVDLILLSSMRQGLVDPPWFEEDPGLQSNLRHSGNPLQLRMERSLLSGIQQQHASSLTSPGILPPPALSFWEEQLDLLRNKLGHEGARFRGGQRIGKIGPVLVLAHPLPPPDSQEPARDQGQVLGPRPLHASLEPMAHSLDLWSAQVRLTWTLLMELARQDPSSFHLPLIFHDFRETWDNSQRVWQTSWIPRVGEINVGVTCPWPEARSEGRPDCEPPPPLGTDPAQGLAKNLYPPLPGDERAYGRGSGQPPYFPLVSFSPALWKGARGNLLDPPPLASASPIPSGSARICLYHWRGAPPSFAHSAKTLMERSLGELRHLLPLGQKWSLLPLRAGSSGSINVRYFTPDKQWYDSQPLYYFLELEEARQNPTLLPRARRRLELERTSFLCLTTSSSAAGEPKDGDPGDPGGKHHDLPINPREHFPRICVIDLSTSEAISILASHLKFFFMVNQISFPSQPFPFS